MTKIITLTKGQVTQVSDGWFEELNKDKWHALYNPHTKSYYAARTTSRLLGKKKYIYMHRVVAGTPDGMKTDHRDGDTLNNQPDNLRTCTNAQNMSNQGKHSNNTSGFKGVYLNRKKWAAHIMVDGKFINLDTYKTREEAAHAYDEAAKKYHGEFAKLNFEEIP